MTQEQVNQLSQLQKLYESGVLSAEEFAAEKAKVLNGGSKTKFNGNNFKQLWSKINTSKYKIPLLILFGMIFGFVCLFIVSRFVPIFSKEIEVNKAEITEAADDDIFEDKFERLWVIGTTRDYTEEDFEGWNKDDLKILRNYFFAKVNYVFAAKDLNEYFSRYSWYQELYVDVTDDTFTDLQINNVQFIKKLEGLSNSYKSPK